MAIAPRLEQSDIPDSPYADELRRVTLSVPFDRKLEPEYVRSHLIHSRTLIRAAVVLGMLLLVLRGVDQTVKASWNAALLGYFGLVVASSAVLTGLAWSRSFERLYLPCAQIVVPLRNAILAAQIAAVAARGELDFLMVMPLTMIGPFFFLGLGFRAALVSGVLTIVSGGVSAIYFGLALPVALHAGALQLAALVACAIAARQMEKRTRTRYLEHRLTEEMAQFDALTGAKNRRIFDAHLAQVWQQAVRDGRTLAILLLDVDHFKTYNDHYGHQAGDHALRQVAQTAQAFIRRPVDIFARYGGEEFAAVLYDVDGRSAEGIAHQMRRAVEALAIEHLASRTAVAITISVGVAVIEPTRERNSGGALQLADQALYEAKVKGRNRVELMDETQYRLLVTGAFTRHIAGLPRRA
jgi:diguanylate cyclase (GGDEF)-like protein